MECDIFPSVLWHCWLGDRKGIRPVKRMDVGLLVVMMWLEHCTTYSSSGHHHFHHPLLQSTPANPGSPGKWPLKRREREENLMQLQNKQVDTKPATKYENSGLLIRQIQRRKERTRKSIRRRPQSLSNRLRQIIKRKISPVGDWRSTSIDWRFSMLDPWIGSWPWPWPWIRPHGIPSCITHRPLATYQISLRSEE